MNSGTNIDITEIPGNIRNKGYILNTPISLKIEVILSAETIQDLHHIHRDDIMVSDLISSVGEESRIAIVNYLNKKLRNV